MLPCEPEPAVGVARPLLASITGVPAPPLFPFEPEPEPVSSGYTVIVSVVVEVEVIVVVPLSAPPDGAAVTWPLKSVGTDPDAVMVTV